LIQVPCLPKGGDSCRDYNKLLIQVPCLPAGGDSCRDYNKLLTQVPCLPAGGDSCRDYNKLLTQVPCLPAGRPACRQAGIPVGTTFFIVENDHDIEAIYWPHISSGTGFLQNSILAE
jgi:hypothetical protein